MIQSDHQTRAEAWFQALQKQIIGVFEKIEDDLASGPHASHPAGRFERKAWTRYATNNEPESGPGGGGTMAVMKGRGVREGRCEYIHRLWPILRKVRE